MGGTRCSAFDSVLSRILSPYGGKDSSGISDNGETPQRWATPPQRISSSRGHAISREARDNASPTGDSRSPRGENDRIQRARATGRTFDFRERAGLDPCPASSLVRSCFRLLTVRKCRFLAGVSDGVPENRGFLPAGSRGNLGLAQGIRAIALRGRCRTGHLGVSGALGTRPAASKRSPSLG